MIARHTNSMVRKSNRMLGEALQRSASAFNTAHTDLDKSIAIITASNEVLQDPEKVGTMWNTSFYCVGIQKCVLSTHLNPVKPKALSPQ